MAVIDQIYEAVGDDEAFAALPATVASLVGARSCAIFERDKDFTLRTGATSYFSQEQVDYQKIPEIAALDVWTVFGSEPHRLGRVNASDEYLDSSSFLETPYYHECFRRFGDDTVRALGGVVCTDTGYLSLAVHSGLGAKRFDASHLRLIEEHIPHVFRMLDFRARFEVAQEKGDLLQRALDQMPNAVLALDSNLRVRAANHRGGSALSQGQGLKLVGGRVTTTNPTRQDRLARAVRSAATWSGGRGDAILLPRLNGRPALRVLVSPMTGPHAVAVVIIEDPDDQDPGLAATLASLYGLTTSEAELAALLANGLSPEEAAEARDVRLSTVRTQIKRLLDKTEATRLLDLVRLLSRTPRGPRSGGNDGV